MDARTYQAAIDNDYARANAETVMVPRYRASVTVVRHVGFADELTYVNCDHEHETKVAAEACARRLARKHVTVIL